MRRMRAAAAALLIAMAGPAPACEPGAHATCRLGLAPDPGARIAPLSRADIDARIGTPGPPIVDEVARDTARTWEAVRRQSRRPAIAYPHEGPHMGAKGDMR